MTDLTPSWDDIDPAELDFGGGASDADVVALDAEPVDVDIPPGPSSVSDVGATDSASLVDEARLDVIEDTDDETPFDAQADGVEGVDDFDEFEDLDAQFDDDPADIDDVPDDFDVA